MESEKRREMFVGTRAEPSCRETKVAIVRRSGQSPFGTGGKGPGEPFAFPYASFPAPHEAAYFLHRTFLLTPSSLYPRDPLPHARV